ncbi:MAG: hypothetical protein WBD22_08735 [Pyrinomonadaceae bacterium]
MERESPPESDSNYHERTFRSFDGFEIYVVGLSMSLTYSGVLEGTPEICTRSMRSRPKQLMEGFASDDTPFLFLDSAGTSLLDIQWLGNFECHATVGTNDFEYRSHLCVCWFTKDIPRDLHEMLSNTLKSISWKTKADDYCWLDG